MKSMDDLNENKSMTSAPAPSANTKFCAMCGHSMSLQAQDCPSCGHPCSVVPSKHSLPSDMVSEKKFGTAVALCGVFGILGIHHFYLGNILHGIADFLLCVVGLTCLGSGDPSLVLMGLLLLCIDCIHTFWVMVRLFTGNTRDGHGKLVVYPGQV